MKFGIFFVNDCDKEKIKSELIKIFPEYIVLFNSIFKQITNNDLIYYDNIFYLTKYITNINNYACVVTSGEFLNLIKSKYIIKTINYENDDKIEKFVRTNFDQQFRLSFSYRKIIAINDDGADELNSNFYDLVDVKMMTLTIENVIRTFKLKQIMK